MREEIFGPVCCINTFKTEEEIIQRANDTSYGLYSAVFTKDLNRAIRVSNELQAGTVTVNSYGAGGGVAMPFGGYKVGLALIGYFQGRSFSDAPFSS